MTYKLELTEQDLQVLSAALGIILMQSIENYLTVKNSFIPIIGVIPSFAIIYWYIIRPVLNNTQK